MASWLSLSLFMLQYSLGIVILREFILSCCLCVIDLWVADLGLLLFALCGLGGSTRLLIQMIDIFISRGECSKTLSVDIYLERGILRPNTLQAHPSRLSHRPKFSRFALSVSLKDRTGLKLAARDRITQRWPLTGPDGGDSPLC